jgi:hypothetical protein
MVKIRRKKSMDRRIVVPGEFGGNVADQAARNFREMQANPVYPVIQQLMQITQQLKQDFIEVTAKQLGQSIHLNALLDYMNNHNLLMSKSPSYEDYLGAHRDVAILLNSVVKDLRLNKITMREAMVKIKSFNTQEGQLIQIRGDNFGLSEWLAENPEKLTEVELDEIGKEFGLTRVVEVNESNTQEKASTEKAPLSVETTTEG